MISSDKWINELFLIEVPELKKGDKLKKKAAEVKKDKKAGDSKKDKKDKKEKKTELWETRRIMNYWELFSYSNVNLF